MFGIDECADAAVGLGIGDRMQSHRRLAAGLRAVDLNHPASRKAADTKSYIEGNGAGGNDLDRSPDLLTQAHHRSLSILFVDLRECCLECLLAIFRGAILGGHRDPSPARWTFSDVSDLVPQALCVCLKVLRCDPKDEH